jgi:gliding motility-associated-like protein
MNVLQSFNGKHRNAVKAGYCILLLTCLHDRTYAQAILNIQGASIFTDQGTMVRVNGDVSFTDGTILHNGVMEITGNWANDNENKNEAFDPASTGDVKLITGVQEIQGYQTTAFPTLSLEGWDRKVLRVNTKVTRNLNLNNNQLDVNGNDMWVTNTNTGAITRSTGYVNTSGAPLGRLIRSVSGGASYDYPLGGGAPYRYRPVNAVPTDDGVLGAQFQNYDPNLDGFDRNKIFVSNFNKINDRFYHVVHSISGVGAADVKLAYNAEEDGGPYTGLARWMTEDHHWVDGMYYFDATEAGEGTDHMMHYRFDDNGAHVLALIDTISSDPPLFIVSGFTPNGDGKNDYFAIKGLEKYRSNELKIYDRWGRMVYTAVDYKNDWAGDGLDMDTYMYFLRVRDLQNREHILKGDVTLIR